MRIMMTVVIIGKHGRSRLHDGGVRKRIVAEAVAPPQQPKISKAAQFDTLTSTPKIRLLPSLIQTHGDNTSESLMLLLPPPVMATPVLLLGGEQS